MSVLRRDIADAAAKMVVTFGARSAVRGLEDELASGERVQELAACTFAGAEGVAALTTLRVIAIRNDYSKHHVQSVPLAEVQTLDYDPTVHDGFALFTATGRLVVRKMRREDGDRLVDALLTRAPHVVIQVTRPVGTPPVQPPPQLGRLGRHRKPAAVRPAAPAAFPAPWAPEPTIAPAAAPAAPAAATGGPSVPPAVSAQAAAAHSVAQAVSTPVAVPLPADSVPAVPAPDVPMPVVPAPEPVPAAAVAEGAVAALSVPAPTSPLRPATDKEVLLGLLADLHTQGVLTTEEFAAKVRLIVQQP